MMDNTRTLNYNFSHVALPVIALWTPKKFYNSAFRGNARTYLEGIWRGLSKKMGATGSPKEIEVRRAEFKGSIDVLLICTPSPSELLDTFFLGIVACTKKRLFGTRLDWLRYFTLELGSEAGSTARRYCVCEWRSPHPRPDRENHGTIPSPDIELFLRAVEIQVRGTSDRVHEALNASGDPSGDVVEYPSGQNMLIVNDNADMNSMVHSLALVFAQDLKPEDRIVFSRWAGLPEDEWSSSHKQLCALAYMHYLCDVKESGASAPEEVRECAEFLTRDALPSLPRPLNAQVKTMFCRMLGG